jgi:hypothetical protein
MELPNELWVSILQKTRTIQSCNKLYLALPLQTRKELKEIYESHKEKLNIKILCAFQNKLALFNNNNLEFEFQLEDIFAVRYIQNWDTPIGKKDCIVAATKTGLVIFWDAHTMEYIQGIEVGCNMCDIEFHPTKSIMLSVGEKWTGLEIKIWKYDRYWKIIRIKIEVLGDDKKFYYFHQTEPQVYIFSSNNSKILRMYVCNYDIQFPSIMGIIENFIYLNDYYTPLKINSDNSFECIKNDGVVNYFCKFRISDFDIEEIQLQPVCEESPTILDFLRIGMDIYFHTNNSECQTIYKQTGNDCKIIYKTTNKISKIMNKNNFLVFIEKDECKYIDLESLEIDGLSIDKSSVDFCLFI